MNYEKHSLVGRKIHRYSVIKRVGQHPVSYLCECDCGNLKVVRKFLLTNGLSKSCGCLSAELSSKRAKARKTGNLARKRGTLAYFKVNTWGNVNKRTVNGANPNPNKYSSYFKKGIRLNMNKKQFYDFCDKNQQLTLDMYSNNQTPSLDRIDNNGHYDLNNIQIITFSENSKKGSK